MSKRILVVEDQADNRQIIRDMLAPTAIMRSRKLKAARRRSQLSQSSSPISF
jgi:CheY-like chemotaxis protein